MKDIKKLAIWLWLATVFLGFVYSQETVYPNGTSQRWSVNGLGLLGLGLLIASIQVSLETYKLLRLWLHQQGLLDRSAKLPIRLNFLTPFLICFFSFSETSKQVIEGATVEVTRGWGDPTGGGFCFLLLAIFFIILQVHEILKRHVATQLPPVPSSSID